jgi:hypothetical protein
MFLSTEGPSFPLLGLLSGIAIGAYLTGCSSKDPMFAEGELPAFTVESDKASYSLTYVPLVDQDQEGFFTVQIPVAITNPLDRTVYLHPHCGTGVQPSRRLVRSIPGPAVALTLELCLDRGLVPPRPLGPGETYSDTVALTSDYRSDTHPPVTMEMRTGEFHLVYDIQPNSSSAPLPVDPFAPRKTKSNTFTILPPVASRGSQVDGEG